MVRVETLTAVVESLFGAETIDAVVADGWPRPMVEAGFALHRRTWDVARLAAALCEECAALSARPAPPGTLTHVWPALPGAGVTPVLHGALLGVPRQRIKPGRRAAHFAARFVDVWRQFDDTLELVQTLGTSDRYVVSGSDATVAAIVAHASEDRIVGYGDRHSFAVVVDDGDACRHVEALATDVVMWFGRGCFSAGAVLFVGEQAPGLAFGAALAEAVARREHELAPYLEDDVFAARGQALGVAEFETTVWRARLGWVELRERWSAPPREADVVALVICDDPDAALNVPPHRRQGVAWCGPRTRHFASIARDVTRVCEAGELQAPPPEWAHDGVSNAAALLGLRSGRIGF